jgi:chromosome segregation ATPase
VITIQSAMLVALGFFSAGLIGFLLAPLYGRRSARLATEQLHATMPLTSMEIAADKDRLRATYALTIHKLEQKVERATYSAARQRVELSRRDASISDLEGEVGRLRSALEEHENARRVLEQTIADRMPKVEYRLNETKKLLTQRDREIGNLTQTSGRQSQALDEATQINAQQRDEIHRLNATLAARAARNRETLADPRFDGEVALRSEIEALRTKTREQASVISKLQGTLSKSAARIEQGDAVSASAGGLSAQPSPASGEKAAESMEAAAEINRLRKDLVDAENALRSARGMAEAGNAGQAARETEIRTLKTVNEDLAAEAARLRAALATYEAEDVDDRTMKESKVAMRARVSALQAQAEEQSGTIQRLRAEIAAANEKLARQAAHFMDEMRRLGAGTLPTSGARREANIRPKQPLVERINAPRPPRPEETGMRREGEDQRVSGFLRALDGVSEVTNGAAASKVASPDTAAADGDVRKPVRRASLIERITRAEKPVA